MTEYATDEAKKQDAAAFHDALKPLASSLPSSVIRLTLKGPVPCKKNLWNPRRDGGQYIDKEIKAQIDSLVSQAMSQWSRRPIEHPDVDIELFVLDERSDRDNKVTCILDVLRDAGVIVNDNVKRFNGTLVTLPAVVGNIEGVVIDISEKQQVIG